MAKSNICIVGLTKNLTNDVCVKLAELMDMFYADVEKIVQFEIMDKNKMEEVCGLEYLVTTEKKVVQRICTYDNALININYANLNNSNNLEVVKENCLLMYIKLDQRRFFIEQDKDALNEEQKHINFEVFSDRDYLCENMADLVIDCDDMGVDAIVQKIAEKMIEYYEKRVD